MNSRTKIVILAAGKGTRMQADIPKAMTLFRGEPFIAHLLRAVEKSGIDTLPTIVVGHRANMVMDAVGDRALFSMQEKQLGTGHAVLCAKETLGEKADDIMVLYGDMPLIREETIKTLRRAHTESRAPITMMTVKVPDFNDWRASFDDFGRIIRDSGGSISAIVEKKDATPEERAITELNPAIFCFNGAWL
ncbi:NTP transferase domain-containing protein, partial [bacterium]|nr:NTP transferase domain-containing protein [bacterium]